MTIIDVWQKIDSGYYETIPVTKAEWKVPGINLRFKEHSAIHEFQENLRDVFEPADNGEDWVKVWNFALGAVESMRTSLEIPEEKQFHAWMKFIADIVLNYYYYFWDFDALEGCDITHTPINV